MTDLLNMVTEVNKVLFGDNYSKNAEEKYNYALIENTQGGKTSEELWVLVNADYDYTEKRFIKLDLKAASFAIQMQAKGTYPDETKINYNNIQGINVWRSPRWLNDSDQYIIDMDETLYDYTDTKENQYIGAKYNNESWGTQNGQWKTFGIPCGWNNNFTTDSRGGFSIGGAGIDINGNGIFPSIRFTSSVYTDENDKQWFLTGLLDNAYHPTADDWECVDNNHYSWFVGLKSPQKVVNNNPVDLTKDSSQTTFVIMVNDNTNLTNPSNEHKLNVSSWKVLFEVGLESVQYNSNGTLTPLGRA